MSADQISLSLPRGRSTISTRTLGTLGMIASPLLFAEGMLFSLGYAESPYARLISLLGIGYLLGWACSLVGMRRLRATGPGAVALAFFIIQLVGLFLAAVFNVQEMMGANPDSLFYFVTDLAWPASHILMLVLGTLVLLAKVWRGWRVVAPFLCGLALPAFFAIKAIAGITLGGFTFGVTTTMAFMLLGYAVRTSTPAAERASGESARRSEAVV